MSDPNGPRPSQISYFGLAYALISMIALIGAVLVIWPGTGREATWVRSMSDEMRYVAIAAIGGAIGTGVRATALIGGGGEELWKASGKLNLILRALVAIQVAIISFLTIRSFIVLPTTPVTQLSPFGVLTLGLLAGVIAENLIPTLTARILEPSNAKLDSRLDRIANAVGANTLDNYNGRICAQILPGREVGPKDMETSEDDCLWLEPNRRYTLLAWFEPGTGSKGRSEAISISGGNDVTRITFTVAADSSAGIGFNPGRQVCNFDPKKESDRVAFEFVAPVIEAPFTLWLRVTQKDRLSAVLALQATAMSRDGE